MALFHHHAGSDGELVTSFHIRQGDRAAGLDWTLRDGSGREILVFQSTHGVVGDGVDPTIDHRQRVVYQGSGLAARVDDDLSDDIAYSYCDDMRYHYSVFARGDDGDWYLQLAATVAPRSVRSWQCKGRQSDDENLHTTEDQTADGSPLGRWVVACSVRTQRDRQPAAPPRS